MQRVLTLCAALAALALSPAPSCAALNIAWGSCVGSGGTARVRFDCDSSLGTVYELVGSFQSASPSPAMERAARKEVQQTHS